MKAKCRPGLPRERPRLITPSAIHPQPFRRRVAPVPFPPPRRPNGEVRKHRQAADAAVQVPHPPRHGRVAVVRQPVHPLDRHEVQPEVGVVHGPIGPGREEIIQPAPEPLDLPPADPHLIRRGHAQLPLQVSGAGRLPGQMPEAKGRPARGQQHQRPSPRLLLPEGEPIPLPVGVLRCAPVPAGQDERAVPPVVGDIHGRRRLVGRQFRPPHPDAAPRARRTDGQRRRHPHDRPPATGRHRRRPAPHFTPRAHRREWRRRTSPRPAAPARAPRARRGPGAAAAPRCACRAGTTAGRPAPRGLAGRCPSRRAGSCCPAAARSPRPGTGGCTAAHAGCGPAPSGAPRGRTAPGPPAGGATSAGTARAGRGPPGRPGFGACGRAPAAARGACGTLPARLGAALRLPPHDPQALAADLHLLADHARLSVVHVTDPRAPLSPPGRTCFVASWHRCFLFPRGPRRRRRCIAAPVGRGGPARPVPPEQNAAARWPWGSD